MFNYSQLIQPLITSIVSRWENDFGFAIYRMLLAVEPFFLQDDGWDAAFKQGQPGVVSSRYDSKNAHGLRAISDPLGG